ncbi:optic atrophy 3 protein-domain-containing protein [Clohesyomyces aquaticus]|uniref:Optic atrophy 3 protein-domain-containing protein n=1 Tax=Clohesyomyces aquaticus TaxID=1231657 RepID=A0A1Y1Z5Z5_9PLEO|nr:optic atrophy 3 protein-domain-containing protein [Clohesyomyces aquaticus]
MSLTLKITSLFVRTLAKPMANAIKRNAHEHERFRKLCVSFAQRLHRIDMRMRLGLLQDPAVIDRQIAKEVAAAEAARKKAQIPTVKTEAQMKAEDAMSKEEKEAIRKKAEAAHNKPPRIRPLSEAKAIETGANFVAETFIFSVGIGVIVFEQWRQRRKAKNQRDDLREELEELQAQFMSVKTELEEVKTRQVPEPQTGNGKLLGFWKGKGEGHPTDPAKHTDKPAASKPTTSPPPPLPNTNGDS